MKDKKKRNKKTQKSLQSDDLPSLQRGAEFKLRTPKLRIRIKKKELKKNISKSTTLSFFLFLYPTSSSIATLIVQQDQYIFYNHFKVPLIFF